MELRQLRYFVAVAEELHFGRAAARLHIAGPSLSQQIKALERDLGVQLLVRDRRRVVLTAAGRGLVEDARSVLAAAQTAREHAAAAGRRTGVRLGYVSWLPDELAALTIQDVDLRVDEWVLPSHAQAERVADGSLDLAICWLGRDDVDRLNLAVDLLWAEPLRAVSPSAGPPSVAAGRLAVLVDGDQTSWSSWNRYARAYCIAVGATEVFVNDGGVTGPAFFQHVRRLGRPVLASPKRHPAPLPPDLRMRPVIDPTPLWCWSIVRRRSDDRTEVLATAAALVRLADAAGWRTAPTGTCWVAARRPARRSPCGRRNRVIE